MPKSQAEYKRTLREKKRKQGYVLKQIWVKPENWQAIYKLIKGVDDEGCQSRQENC